MTKIVPFLWFDTEAEAAVNFYVSLFPNSKISSVIPGGEGADGKPKVMSVNFELDGRPFIALNGGPQYKFTEAISFFIECHTQEEIDHLWTKLCEGGQPGPCGWLKDRWGLSWQVVPANLGNMLGDPDAVKASRVMNAMMQMQKLDMNVLQAAYDNPES